MGKINFITYTIFILLGGSVWVGAQSITGELKKWHKLTLTFESSTSLSESGSPNPFLDYRLLVTFTNGGSTYVVPGYFAADGNAGESSATEGTFWVVHFAPDKVGTWNYVVSFRNGNNIAVSDNPNEGEAVEFDGESGSFVIGATDKSGRDHRGKGRLEYVGRHHLRFAETGEYFMKGGSDAPENFLAYQDFDNTPDNGGRRKTWGPHVKDWKQGDPVWKGDKGKGIIGAVNYLSSKGMNAFSFLTMNIAGDDKNVFPYISDNEWDRTRFDVSKLAQWEVVFEHADKMGMYLHFKTQETENDQLLNNGNLGVERKLYYRELMARFGHHLALNWNLGEENTQTNQQVKDMAKYFYDHDPYRHHIVIHTYPGEHDKYNQWIGDNSEITGASIQTGWSNVHDATLEWVVESGKAGKPWVVANDEQGSANDGVVPDSEDPNHDGIRKETLWGNLMAGGAGVEYYFGYQHDHSDLTAEDFRSRENMWTQTRYALDFFNEQIPFWEMESQDNLTSENSDFVLAKLDSVYLIYDKNGGDISLDFGNTSGAFTGSWFNPRTGTFEGNSFPVTANGVTDLGTPPGTPSQDWVLLIVQNGYTLPVMRPSIYEKLSLKVTYQLGELNIQSFNDNWNSAIVYNLLGDERVRINKGESSHVNLKKGLYFVRVQVGSKRLIQKLLIP